MTRINSLQKFEEVITSQTLIVIKFYANWCPDCKRTEEISTFKEWLVPIKPNYLFDTSIQTFREQEHPVIVGGGASGVELALSILAWQK
ncbi:hypothetical protein JMM81_21745 [Bacillus sp. V3B]|uniref:thioredoxin family protein n=1 Tax=Bacillus sp. V3B TaxID=2804915 RepID=UPI00210D155E|nr:thioredoxin domain-containing protein [Bacillus sp. V3B]MCQ6277488.1 hypothetical protein [Bacillus sp. V3B]